MRRQLKEQGSDPALPPIPWVTFCELLSQLQCFMFPSCCYQGWLCQSGCNLSWLWPQMIISMVEQHASAS